MVLLGSVLASELEELLRSEGQRLGESQLNH